MVSLLQRVQANPVGAFLYELYEKRQLIWQLTKRDFMNRYSGSTLGLFWAFAQPFMMMLILWFVFTFGLKSGPSRGDVPFVAWFFPAMIAWNFFADTVLMSSNVLHEYAFLVKKVKFKVAILPIVKVLSATILHAVFLFIMLCVLAINGIYPTIFWLQAFYYLLACFVMLVGLSWVLSALTIFLKDVGQIVGIVIQFGFWVTPVLWDATIIPDRFQRLIKLNPMYYIVEGYRGTFLYHTPFWTVGTWLTVYYWAFALTLLAFGVTIFRRLRPHFADVL